MAPTFQKGKMRPWRWNKWFVLDRAACQQPGRDRNTFTDGAKLVPDDHPWAAVCLYKIAQNMLISQCSLWPLYFLFHFYYIFFFFLIYLLLILIIKLYVLILEILEYVAKWKKETKRKLKISSIPAKDSWYYAI